MCLLLRVLDKPTIFIESIEDRPVTTSHEDPTELVSIFVACVEYPCDSHEYPGESEIKIQTHKISQSDVLRNKH